ncbi:MAG: hypothetical protein SNJ63_00830 [Sphingomonadaceae bacterium]
MLRVLSLGRFAGLALLALLLGYVAAISLPHDPWIRYQAFQGTIFERLRWFYERIHYDETPVDVVILGASRENAAFAPPLVDAALKARGVDANFANLSLAAVGMDIRLTVLDELLKAKKPKLVLVSVTEQLPRDGHQAFGELATTGEILTSPLLINRNLPENVLRLPFRQIMLSVKTAVPQTFGLDPGFVPERYAGTLPRLTPVEIHGGRLPRSYLLSLPPDAHRDLIAREAARRKRQLTRPILPDALADAEFGVSRVSLERIIARARAHGADVAFLFLPFYDGLERPLDAEWLEARAPLWTTNHYMYDAGNFSDAGHVRDVAKPGMADWLAGRIADHFAARGLTAGVSPRSAGG